ncbi:TRAP transporter substrate-binding protein DctP [Halomonas urumqiensis]|uniref:C4-dicarboxylate ABC transporter n=1 Tax=Halomonas urumqiensis TaxID=1684789 RepID=A0A2N7UNL0_9GAMM|nr:TRAP transporter substrate-binding protein DctP [Halomonas urumqiensis]PMR82017.1 C4-dicarboxylate ABC transporter [Halomonas urumqiensis]PTB02651.1 C4-dicarboxylate ABC transporter [Halomonas urumqiensis]GHE21137.1 C4-dicarboxylate ABC transporter [Halomonas urumqiensis]
MPITAKCRGIVAVGAMMVAATTATLAVAQDTPTLRFSAVFSDQDIRADMMQRFEDAIADDFNMELHYGGTLFSQGSELVALQRGNLEMSNVAPQDIANQIPAWSILTSAYLFRDADHLLTFFQSEAGEEMKSMAEEQLNVRILGPTFFGTRHVGLVDDERIETPEDLSGVRLRMPPGESWQFLGESLGANPTAMAYAEVYTGLQTGAIDGQDNPLPNVQNMRFYEVMDQIALTSHLVAFDLLMVSSSVWNDMSPEQQQEFQAAADEAIAWSTAEHERNEQELADFFREEGLDLYTPDVDAFREYAQQKYLESSLSDAWPEGMLERINDL